MAESSALRTLHQPVGLRNPPLADPWSLTGFRVLGYPSGGAQA